MNMKRNADKFRSLIDEMPPIERDTSLPLWVKVKDLLSAAIHHPSVEPDTRLPSEQNLCEQLNVSRPIIRMALDALVSAGLITKVARQGIFVSRRNQELDFASQNSGLFGEIGKGHKITTQVLRWDRGVPSAHERKVLELPPPADVVRVTRVYYVDEVATAVVTLKLAGHRVPGIEAWFENNVSVYGILNERFTLKIASSERWFEAVTPTREESKLLGIQPMQPVISVESVGSTRDGAPLEYYTAVFNTFHRRIKVTARS